MSEREAVALLGWNGWPLSCHLMLTAGPRATFGLLSPGDRPIERGDPFTTAFGIWGALTCRAGFVVEDADELPDAIRDYVDRLVGPYFAAIGEWYAALRIGQTGGALQAIIDQHLGDPFFGIFINPGHQIHLDEWVSSPIYRGSTVELRSGMALQVGCHPGNRHRVLHDQHRGRNRPRRRCAAGRARAALPRPVVPRRAATRLHVGLARHRSASRRPPAIEHPGGAGSLPAAAGPRDVDRRMTGLHEIVLRSEEMEVVILPDVGGTDPPDPSVRRGHPADTR